MFDIVIDGNTELNEKFLNHPINEYAAIYLKASETDFAFFERYNDIWTWETKEGKYQYIMHENYLAKDFIEDMKTKFNFKDNWFIRVYETEKELKKMIMPGQGRLPVTEILANIELKRLGEENIRIIKEDDSEENEEKISQFLETHKLMSKDIIQIINLLSVQGHNQNTINFVMKTIESILRGINLTPLRDEEENEEDWVELNEDEVNKSREIYENNGFEVDRLFVNIRQSRIVKVIYTNGVKMYFDNNSKIFSCDKENWYFSPKESVQEIKLPWSFTPTSKIILDDPEQLEDMFPLND